MKKRLNEYATCLLENKNVFTSANPTEWTAEQQEWNEQWLNYIAKGGVRPPTAPPH